MRRSIAVLLCLVLAVGLAPAATAGPAAAPVPDTPVGRQVSWLLDVSHRLPLTEAEAREHLSAAVLAAIGLPQLNEALTAVSGGTGLALLRYQEQSPRAARFLASGGGARWLGGMSVDGAGLVASLTFSPYLDAPASWAELDRRLHAVAPRVSLLAAAVDERRGRCRPVHGVAPHATRPLGSAFKLYVLGALAHQVRAGRAAWDEPLAIRDDWKSLPGGVLQDLPAGTELPLRAYANNMIAISDNTATDHLINRLGRRAVERQQVRFGMARPWRNAPFLTTREFFTLKLDRYPTLLDTYRRLPPPLRRLYLEKVIAQRPLPPLDDAADWTTPRAIDTVEWFASPADICRAFVGLSRQAATPGLEPVGTALSLNDGGLWLDPAGWPTTWFKGGSEVGVLTLNYLARTAEGQAYVVSVMVSDPTAAVPEATAIPELQALARGAFALLAGSPGAGR